MRFLVATFAALALASLAAPARAQAPGKWPPDTLVNLKVIAPGTPVPQVLATMRAFSGALGVRCTHCHVGEEGAPLARVDFASDAKRAKLVARRMMLMVRDANAHLDSIPERQAPALAVTCMTCHRGVARPVPLATVISDAAIAVGADSAARAYRLLRERHFGRDAYDFGEGSLNAAALRTARAGKVDEALALLRLQEEHFPRGAGSHVARGNVLLLRGDTTGAAAAFREALLRDSTSQEARGRLREIGRQ